jgi:hypothetical protein
MSEFRIDQISNQAGTAGPDIAGITTFSSTSGLLMPSGVTEYRGGRGRGVFVSGTTSAIPTSNNVNIIDYLTIATLGNATDFGDSTAVGNEQKGGCASSTRGVYHTTSSNILEYITISSTGNAFDFGDLNYGGAGTNIRQTQLCSNSTRGLISAGYVSNAVNYIEFITISTLGNASSFGTLLTAAFGSGASVASPTRAVHFLSQTPSNNNVLEYNTISTLGNSQDFGDLVSGVGMRNCGSCSSSVRGIFSGGGTSPSAGINAIEYITIATLGDSIDFGDLLKTNNYRLSGTSSSTRGVFGGGETIGGSTTNVIDYITINSTGNAQDFGDLTVARSAGSSLSDAHGGLGD